MINFGNDKYIIFFKDENVCKYILNGINDNFQFYNNQIWHPRIFIHSMWPKERDSLQTTLIHLNHMIRSQ
jgi:hypothetical protein